MASKEPGRDSKKMGEPFLEMRSGLVSGHPRHAWMPFFVDPIDSAKAPLRVNPEQAQPSGWGVEELTNFLNSIKRPIQIGKQVRNDQFNA